MTTKHVVMSLLALAALVALVLAWPALVRMGKNPVMGNWVPTEDPGTMLVAVNDDGVEILALGLHYHSLQLRTAPTGGYTRVQAHVRPERDGVLGPDDVPGIGGQDLTFGEPQRNCESTLSGGFDGGHCLFADLQHKDGVTTKVILCAPIELRRGSTTPWQPLVAVQSLGVLIEWQQTKDALQVRAGPTPGASMPQWDGGSFQVLKAQAAFVADGDHQVASLPLVQVASLADGPSHSRVLASASATGFHLEVRVQ